MALSKPGMRSAASRRSRLILGLVITVSSHLTQPVDRGQLTAVIAVGIYNTLGAVARTGPNKGCRSYAARGYFEANAGRPNLHVLCDALVTSIELDGERATGVNFTYGSSTHSVKASREIIVSAGTIQSPQILELSGIGDPEVLKKAGVECKIKNTAVGANFQDHVLSVSTTTL